MVELAKAAKEVGDVAAEVEVRLGNSRSTLLADHSDILHYWRGARYHHPSYQREYLEDHPRIGLLEVAALLVGRCAFLLELPAFSLLGPRVVLLYHPFYTRIALIFLCS